MKTTTKVAASLLLLLNFLLLHYILSSIPLRLDLTEDRIYTLSSSSKRLLSKIEDPVTVELYTSKSLAELPPWFKTFSARVEQMLEQYQRASGGRLRLEVIDPKPDTAEEERAIAAGLHGQELATGDRVFLGMVVAQGDTEVVHPFFDWNRETYLEYDISRLVHEAQQFTKPRLGLIASLPLEAPPMPMMPGQPAPQDQYIVEQLRTHFEIESIEAQATALPADLDLLAIIHPQDLSESLLYAIDQFALSNKPLFIALDPSSIQMREQSRQMQMMAPGMNQNAASDLPQLLAAWGIEYNPTKVLTDPNLALARGAYTQPAWLVFDDERSNRDLLPTSDLGAVLLLEAGALRLAEDFAANWEPIFTTTEEAAQLESMLVQFGQGANLTREARPLDQAVSVAGLLTGELPSAFPDGPPGTDAADGAAEHRASGKVTGFLIADTDWLLDRFSVERINFLGMNSIRRLNDNQLLAANMLEYLGGSEDLIGIRGKGAAQREFTVVRAMEAEAQKAYQEKLQAVEDRLSEISQRVSELLREQQSSGAIYMTPEIESALQENREQEAALRAERREIRRELRQGIERLGAVLGAINLLWAPLGLAVFGILYNRSRKKK